MVQGSSCLSQGRELAEAGLQGHVLGRDQMAHDSAVQQCIGTASAAGPGGKVAQRKSAGTAAPARTLVRWAGHASDSPLTDSAQDFACVEAVGASAWHLFQRVRMG